MTQLVLLVAGMLRRHLCLLRPMRGLFKSMRHTQNRPLLPTLCVFTIGPAFDTVLGSQKVIKKLVFRILVGSGAMLLFQAVAKFI